MSTKFSAHPDLAVEQLQRAELAARQNSSKSHAHHRRHHSVGAGLDSGHSTPSKSTTLISNATVDKTNSSGAGAASAAEQDAYSRSSPMRICMPKTHDTPNVDVLDNKFAYNADSVDMEDRMVLAYIDDIDLNCDDEDDVYIRNANSRSRNTKDCVDCTSSSSSSTLRWSAAGVAASSQQQPEQQDATSVDEPDYLQHRFSRTAASCSSRLPHNSIISIDYYTSDPRASPIHAISDGCVSGLSSALSSPSASTVSSPLSTPTRLAPHFQQQNQNNYNGSNCCQKSLTAGVCCGGGSANSDSDKSCNHLHHHHNHQQQTPQHLHNHHHHHTVASSTSLKSTSKTAAAAASPSSSSSSSGCKKSQKFDPRLLGPSRYRQLLPVVLCILSFAIVFSILIVYMDTTVVNEYTDLFENEDEYEEEYEYEYDHEYENKYKDQGKCEYDDKHDYEDKYENECEDNYLDEFHDKDEYEYGDVYEDKVEYKYKVECKDED
ncbi:protein Star-like [Rhagoletis pomonella]|uniref:protein Star-like n=1 Tax=Rhagoletis pomonella TaxID=28610 RepID=UPI001782B72B|nr:protein Star-like [Rhagoletis pomonella]